MSEEYQNQVFISYASGDGDFAKVLSHVLENKGVRCWMAPRDIAPGASWGHAISDALESSSAVILILSPRSNESAHVISEIQLASRQGIPIIPVIVENVNFSRSIKFLISNVSHYDATGTTREQLGRDLIGIIERIAPAVVPNKQDQVPVASRQEDKSRGYVFISYVRSDAGFVQKLRSVFESKKYGYWDYEVGNRDYHGTLYRELEERIDGAVAFMTIVSDDWRGSDWVASEFLYAREATIPIFVIQAKKLSKPLPILLNLQTRIDMSDDFVRGAETLAQELSKKGL